MITSNMEKSEIVTDNVIHESSGRNNKDRVLS